MSHLSFILYSWLICRARAWGDIDIAPYNNNRYDKGSASVLIRSDKSHIYIAMQADADYVAAGMNPKEGEMPGADIVVCGNYDNNLTATDYHSTSYAKPILDNKQDWTVLHIGRNGTKIYCEISRPKLTCESVHDFQVHTPSLMVAIMLAWGASGSGVQYHGESNRGWKYLAFEPVAESVVGDEVLSTIHIVAPEVTLPSVEGIDICSYHLLPGVDANTTYHITKVKTWWDESPGLAYDLGMAHHVTLIGCPILHESWQDNQILGHCNEAWQFCGSGDLVGQSVSIAPEEGIPFGKGVAAAVVFLRHFYPKSSTGVIDKGSTFMLQYTANLRPFTLGKLVLQSIDLTVPANTLDHHIRVWFPGICSKRNGRTKLTAVNIHMHDRGNSDSRAAIIHHVRNGIELAPIFVLDNFIEGTASEGWFQVDVDVEPGDDIFFECVYDNPSSVTDNWGSGLKDQMCVASISTRTSGPLAVQMYLDRGNGDDASAFTASCPVATYGGLYQEAPSDIQFTGDERQALFAYTPYVPTDGSTDTSLSCAPAPPPAIPSGSIILSGYHCANGYPSGPTNQAHGVNQVYLYAGTTRDGRPYYQGMDTAKHYIFYDANCGGGDVDANGMPIDTWRRGWFIGCNAPSLTASSNLQLSTDGTCCRTANLETLDTTPLGRRSWWRLCGNPDYDGQQDLNLVLVQGKTQEETNSSALSAASGLLPSYALVSSLPLLSFYA